MLVMPVLAATGAAIGGMEAQAGNKRLEANAKLVEQAAEQGRSLAKGVNASLAEALRKLTDASPPYKLHVRFPGSETAPTSPVRGSDRAGAQASGTAVLRLGIERLLLTRRGTPDLDSPVAMLRLEASATLEEQATGKVRFRSLFGWESPPHPIEEWLAEDAAKVRAELDTAIAKLASYIARDHFYAFSYVFTLDPERMPDGELEKAWGEGWRVIMRGPSICWKPADGVRPLEEMFRDADGALPQVAYDLALLMPLTGEVIYSRTGLRGTCHEIEDFDRLRSDHRRYVRMAAQVRTGSGTVWATDDRYVTTVRYVILR